MADPGRNLPKPTPLPVAGAPKKGILVSSSKRAVKPKPQAGSGDIAPRAEPAPPRKNPWRAILTGILLLLIAAVVFVGGMEVGYRRADSRYEPVVKELSDAAKRHVDALQAKEHQIALLAAQAKARPAKEAVAPVAKEASKPASPPPPSNPLAEILIKNAKVPEKTEPAPSEMPKKVPPAQVAMAPKPGVAVKAVHFAQDILPIFQSKCFTCHGNGKKKAGLDLRTLESTTRGGESGAGVVAGKTNGSNVWEWIADDRMPPSKNKLTAVEKARVKEWIVQGGK